jgi:hypothetical protein
MHDRLLASLGWMRAVLRVVGFGERAEPQCGNELLVWTSNTRAGAHAPERADGSRATRAARRNAETHTRRARTLWQFGA